MSQVRVHNFSISLDGFGAGPDQSLQAPLGVGGGQLHGWAVPTRSFQERVFGNPGGGTTGTDEGPGGIPANLAGVDKRGEEFYQVTLGGSGADDAAIGSIIGRAFSAEEIGPAVETLVDAYLDLRRDAGEPFLQTYRRLGDAPFKERLYGTR